MDPEHTLDLAPYRTHVHRWWLVLPLGVIAFLLSQVAAMLVWDVLTLVAPREGDDMELGAMFTDPVGWRGLAAFVTQAAVALALGIGLVRLVEKRPASELVPGRVAFRRLAAGALAGTLLMSLTVGAVAATGHYHVLEAGWTAHALVGLGTGIGAGVAEEIFFRGVLLRCLESRFGSIAALVVTSVLFGGVHLTNPGATPWTALAIAVEAGLLLGALWCLTQDVWAAVGCHAAWNAVQSAVFGVTVSGTESGRGLLRSATDGPEWLSGGSAGVEGSVFAVAFCLAVAVPVLVVARRRGHLVPRTRRSTGTPTRA